MKKILFTTTAIGLLFAGVARADGPSVTLGGYADFQVGSGSQEGLYQHQSALGVANGDDDSIFARELHTRTDTALEIKIDGKADNGLGYGAYIEFNADTSPAEGPQVIMRQGVHMFTLRPALAVQKPAPLAMLAMR